jgi:DNA-binding NarL/FixJ family response regulator
MKTSASVVLVAAAPTLQRQGLLATLQERRPDLFLQATANAHTLPARLRRLAPALLILDVSLPGPPLQALLQKVWRARPQQRLLVLGGRRLPLALQKRLNEMEASTLLARQITPTQVVATVEQLLTSGHLPLPAEAACGLDTVPSNISPRELEILHWVSQDYSTTEIARQLSISARTVDTHRRNLLEKTNTRSMVGLVLHAVRQGWIELG